MLSVAHLPSKPQDDDIVGTAGLDPQRRIRELESDGVVADLIYLNGVPFQAAFNTRGVSAELEREGARAYNRWLGESCSHNPERHAGCAVLQVSDVGEAVADSRLGMPPRPARRVSRSRGRWGSSL